MIVGFAEQSRRAFVVVARERLEAVLFCRQSDPNSVGPAAQFLAGAVPGGGEGLTLR
jgi:hypothetical protein